MKKNKIMLFIIGLGNPGPDYNLTRHNVGFMVLDELARTLDLTWKTEKKFKAEVAQNHALFLVKPLTFMNESGESVKKILAYYKKISKEKDKDFSQSLLVIHDELDIEFGKYKISADSRSAGHRGVQSIIDQLNTKNFSRFRVGIKTTGLDKMPTEKFVLQKFSKAEQEILNEELKKIILEVKNF